MWQRVFRGACEFKVVSALQSIRSLHIFILADQISCRSYIGSVYRMRSFAVCHSFTNLSNNVDYESEDLIRRASVFKITVYIAHVEFNKRIAFF